MRVTVVEYDGKKWRLPDLARKYGLDSTVVQGRIACGWDLEKALTTPKKEQKTSTYRYKGKDYTVAELTRINGTVANETMRERLLHMSVKAAVETPNKHPKRTVRITEVKQKKIFKPTHKGPDLTQCKTCQYHGTFGTGEAGRVYCDYIEVEGHRRPCPPSPNCTACIPGKSLVRKTSAKRYKAF